MLFNSDKCKVMHFGGNSIMMDYTLDSKVLNIVHEEKDLGVVIIRSHDLKASLQCIQAYPKRMESSTVRLFTRLQKHVKSIQIIGTSSLRVLHGSLEPSLCQKKN